MIILRYVSFCLGASFAKNGLSSQTLGWVSESKHAFGHWRSSPNHCPGPLFAQRNANCKMYAQHNAKMNFTHGPKWNATSRHPHPCSAPCTQNATPAVRMVSVRHRRDEAGQTNTATPLAVVQMGEASPASTKGQMGGWNAVQKQGSENDNNCGGSRLRIGQGEGGGGGTRLMEGWGIKAEGGGG